MAHNKVMFWLSTFLAVSLTGAAVARAGAARAPKLVGAEYLLHAGGRSVLTEDINQHGIAQEIWDKFIMSGTGNNYSLPPFRRGLYGIIPEDLANISLYGLDQWAKGRENWVMIIHVKDECRQKRSVVTNYELVYDEPPVTDPFTKWLKAQKKEKTLIQETGQPCLEEGLDKLWNVGTFFGLDDADESMKQRSRTCGGVIQDFFVQTDAKLVVDTANGDPYDPSSWAIRDRSCIEDITGTPEDLFKGIFLGGLSKKGPPVELFGDLAKPGDRPWVTLMLMVSIFGEAPGFLTADWAHVVREFTTKTRLQYIDQGIQDFKEEPHKMRNSEFEIVGYHLLNATAACAKNGKLPELQGLYKSFADWYYARDGKLCADRDLNDPVCRWGGVPAMKGDASKPDLMNWGHTSSVLSLLKEARELCGAPR
ncbi:MAG: hypothetical protein WCW52_05065 [Elusimicrobiales bacterium]|jgi:hypothetical protein